MAPANTIRDLLDGGEDDAPAILAPGRTVLTRAGLREQVERTGAALARQGIGRNDRVAIVLPNGPAMASAFIGVAAGASTAPLNPAYRRQEFEFYLSDLHARALLVERGSTSEAVAVAHDLGIPVLELVPHEDAPAGTFTITDTGASALTVGASDRESGAVGPDDEALVLHTSGTTSRPKIVPLRQRNVCASAANVRAALALEPADLCLNIMPLFHIHGLIAAVLASLAARASIFCTPGFNALRFFAWLEESGASWYTAVPTMHQAILARADRNRSVIAAARIRLIRSSSSSLPQPVMAELESVFGAPVIESYGMTEAAHQMTSNPLPPLPRKPGSVGLPAGPDVAIMDEAGILLERGRAGEIVIRGDNVTAGYENNPAANASSFTDGWFRTGDQGVIDADGYLTITGRLKEIINRGGEKISPAEVDNVLMDHPAVQQVITFAVPDARLGEDIAAAVVLREDMAATERELREFAATRLAAFKVPRSILLLDEIPTGATGKLQRIGLAARLGFTG